MPHHTLTLGFTSHLVSQVLKTWKYLASESSGEYALVWNQFLFDMTQIKMLTDLNQQVTTNYK